MEVFKAVVGAVRTVRSEHDIKRAVDVPLTIRAESDAARAFVHERAQAHLVPRRQRERRSREDGRRRARPARR